MPLSADQLPGLTLAAFPRISLRASPVGGPLLDAPRVTPAHVLVSADELLLLVHGYNNSENQAFDSYRSFLSNLGGLWVERSAGLFWPGDGTSSPARWWSRWMGGLTYPLQPERAEQAAEMLNTLLTNTIGQRREIARLQRRRPPALTLNIVAHSMGCRLVLELLKLLRSALAVTKALEVRNVVLMAAAVPNYRVSERGRLVNALTAADNTIVLWSKKDGTLRKWFRPGQFLERPLSGFFTGRAALGRTGIGLTSRVTAHETKLDHSDYWPSSEIAASIRENLGGISAGPRRRKAGTRVAGIRPTAGLSRPSGRRPPPPRRAQAS